MKKYQLLLLSALSGILLSLSWPAGGFAPLLLIAFVPLLYVRHYINNNREKFGRSPNFKYVSLALLIWNSTTTYWIYFASGIGAFVAILLNTVMFSLAYHLADRMGNKIGSKGFYLALPAFWIVFEHFHLDWDLSWPWMNLGNGFSNATWAIQWYEYTGTFGGTLWILVSNILVFELIKQFFILKKNIKSLYLQISLSLIVVLGPMLVSQFIKAPDYSQNKKIEVVVVQPNIDPYNEKFSGMSANDQLQKLIKLAEEKITPNTRYVIAPETAITQDIFEDEIRQAWSVDTLRKFLSRHKDLKLIIGLTSLREYQSGDKIPETAHKYKDGNGYFDIYNSAMQLTAEGDIQIYHKSKLVAGAEKMPFASLLKPLEKYILDFGGMTGTHGVQESRDVFTGSDSVSAAPAICYESIYGEFVTGYMNNGANFLAIITNDGWWKDTPGYRQHNSYARLRAIETRRWVTRSANTGISGFIDPNGNVIEQSKWWVPTALRQSIYAGDKITFYVRYGDYIARLALWVSALIILLWAKKRFVK